MLFGQEQPVLFGCANATNAQWTYASWHASNEPKPLPLPTDLRYASPGDAPLEPAVYGFDMGFVTDIDHILSTLPGASGSTPPTSSDEVKLEGQSYWPFGDLFRPGSPLRDPGQSVQEALTSWHVEVLRALHGKRGIATFTWHAQNPWVENSYTVTLRNDSTSDVTDLLRGTSAAAQGARGRFRAALDRIADFANACVDAQGRKIPFIFRPFHEMNLTYFWWGKPAGASDVRALFDFTVAHLETKGVDNLLYAYAPNMTKTSAGKTQRRHMVDEFGLYEPSAYDIVGLDAYPARFGGEYRDYSAGRTAFVESVHALREFAASRTHCPLAAITECGVLNIRGFDGPLPSPPRTAAQTPTFRTIPDYWTRDFFPDLERAVRRTGSAPPLADVCYLMLWKNRDATGHAANTTTIHGDVRLTGTTPTGLNRSSTPEQIYAVDEDVTVNASGAVSGRGDEFYGPFKGHPATAGFLQKARRGQIAPSGSTLRLLFLADVPP